MRSRLPLLALAGTLLVLTVLGSIRVARAGHALAQTRTEIRRVTQGEPDDVALRGLRATPLDVQGTMGHTVDLGNLERGVVFVFSSTCGPCHRNMANWTDVARATRREEVPLFALTIGPDSTAAGYWAPLHPHVAVLLTDTTTMIDRLGVSYTPATLLVEHGRVVRRYAGMLSAPAVSDLIRRARAGRQE